LQSAGHRGSSAGLIAAPFHIHQHDCRTSSRFGKLQIPCRESFIEKTAHATHPGGWLPIADTGLGVAQRQYRLSGLAVGGHVRVDFSISAISDAMVIFRKSLTEFESDELWAE
jgi:hypothetical protein